MGMFSRMGLQQQPPALDLIGRYAVRPVDFNEHMPKNLHLIAGGTDSLLLPNLLSRLEETPRANMKQRADPETILVESLKAALRKLSGWKVFFDTDGDLAFSLYTRVTTRVAAGIVMPLEPTRLDFR